MPPPSLPSLLLTLRDIQTHQIPLLLSSPRPSGVGSSGGAGSLLLLNEIVDEIRTDLEKVRRGIQVGLEWVEYGAAAGTTGSHGTDWEGWKGVGREDIESLKETYSRVKNEFKKAMIESKKNYMARQSRIHELAAKSEQQQIDPAFKQTQTAGEAKSAAELGIGGDDPLQTKTSQVTLALRRTTALMQAELEQSVASVQMLESSTQTLTLTNTLHNTYTNLLTASSTLITHLQKADTLDRCLILFSLLFFLLCVGYVLKRRVIDRVGYVISGVGGVGGAVGKGLGAGVGWYIGGSWKLVKMGLGVGTVGRTIDVQGEEEREDMLPRVGAESAVVGQIDDKVYIPPNPPLHPVSASDDDMGSGAGPESGRKERGIDGRARDEL